MLKRLVARAVQEKIGKSRLVDTLQDAYDYVIVGAGAGGNVLASRLSADGKTQVLLLEAGGDDVADPAVHIPASAPELAGGKHDWQYKTVPQTRAGRSLKNRQLSYPSGRGIGGSGTINYMGYTRGSRYDFDEWANLGCTGWSYADVLPYFIKSEHNKNRQFVNSGYHGQEGPIIVEDLHITPLVDAFLEAGKDLGYDVIDINGERQIGFSNIQALMNEGIRWSTADGYLRPAMERENLHVAVEAQVNQILMEGKAATGVEVTQLGQQIKVKANNEVIISAGAIESPKILMLSGIGPSAHLKKHKIPVIADLPVGNNLQDHPMCVLEYTIDRPFTVPSSKAYEHEGAGKDYQQLMFYRGGHHSGVPVAQGGIAYMRTRYAPRRRLYPDLQLQITSTLSGEMMKKTWNLKDEVWSALYEGENKQGFLLMSLLLHPRSSGTVRLQSTDPFDTPLIDPRFLEDPKDCSVLVEGMRIKLQLGNTDAFQAMGAEPSQRVLPSAKHYTLYSNDYLENYVRHHTLTGHHASGTCRMGPVKEDDTVVDPELRVKGIQNLRVVDASVMPRITSGATSAPTVMIAEKAADLIMGENSVRNIKLPDEVLRAAEERLQMAQQS
jgi:choline dehydrogenase